MMFWKKYKIEILIFFTALAVRMIFFVWTRVQFGEAGFLYHGDSVGYLNLAKNLMYHHVFSREDIAPFLPDFLRTPVYPAFIALFYGIFKTISGVIIAQNIIGASTSVLIYCLGKKIFSRIAGLAAAIFFIFEPNMAYWSNELLSETLFVFLLTLGLFLFAKFISGRKISVLISSAVILGLAILTRPIAILAPFILAAFLYVFLRKIFSFRKILILIIIYSLTCGIVLAPWLIRNKIVFNTFSLSNQGAIAICDLNTNAYLAFKELKIGKEGAAKLRQIIEIDSKDVSQDKLFVDDQNKFCKRIFRILQTDPIGYFTVYMKSFVPFFFGDGYLMMLHKFAPAHFKIPATSLWAQIPGGKAVGWAEFLKGYNLIEFVIFLFGKIIWISIAFFALMSVIFGWKDYLKRKYMLLFYFLIIYFVTASGFGAYSRFRQPINPILIILAFYGFFEFVRYVKDKLEEYKIKIDNK